MNEEILKELKLLRAILAQSTDMVSDLIQKVQEEAEK